MPAAAPPAAPPAYGIEIRNKVGSYGETIWGEPGTVWTNTTNQIYYQFHVARVNTCGTCYQYDNAIRRGSWGIPFHRNCRCSQSVCLPGTNASKPFSDFRDTIDGLPDDQKAKVVGVANLKLIKQGVVKWEDVVSPYRVRTLQEVLATKKLTVKELIDAGVSEYIAKRAHAAVHTPAHEALEKHRRQLIENLKGAGLSAEQIAALAARGISGRIVVTEGPSGPSGPFSGGIDLNLLRAFLALSLHEQTQARLKATKPKPGEPPSPLPGWTPGDPPIDPDLPIADRIAQATHLDARVQELADARDRYEALRLEKQAVVDRITKIHEEIHAGTLDIDKGLREIGKLQKRQLKLGAEMTDAFNQQLKVTRAITRLPAGSPEIAWDHQGIDKLPSDLKQRMTDAQNWMEGRVGGQVDATIHWDAASPDAKIRAYAQSDRKSVTLDAQDATHTLIHEWGHHLEYSVPGIHQAAVEFLKQRTAGQTPRAFNDVIPGGQFDADEKGMDDDFTKTFGDRAAYVGKVYPTWTEIVSMGLEQLYDDPVKFAKQDPQYAKFMLGILDGSLRKP